MLLCNYSYKYILYITITIIKKAPIVFFCSHSNAYTPSINIDHLINRICIFHLYIFLDREW